MARERSDDEAHVLDIAVEVYKLRLEDPTGGGKDAVKRMLAADKDNGEKLRGRARAYVPIVRACIKALERGK